MDVLAEKFAAGLFDNPLTDESLTKVILLIVIWLLLQTFIVCFC